MQAETTWEAAVKRYDEVWQKASLLGSIPRARILVGKNSLAERREYKKENFDRHAVSALEQERPFAAAIRCRKRPLLSH